MTEIVISLFSVNVKFHTPLRKLNRSKAEAELKGACGASCHVTSRAVAARPRETVAPAVGCPLLRFCIILHGSSDYRGFRVSACRDYRGSTVPSPVDRRSITNLCNKTGQKCA
ncbi:hypothetical protein AVEN_126885-1 [Araneus ventricosus]|uniref:Uncharacterized protein n=1 Tax=Araneus ventricosus TaxID=182803 RepID=A0A4Y2C2K2_ARAVE|nr:hypothetical protein AVEN_126885-1 [Araneus ventricosus]